MSEWIQGFLDRLAQVYPDTIAFYRARTIVMLSVGEIITGLLYLIGSLYQGGFAPLPPVVSHLSGILLIAIGGFTWLLVASGYSRAARLLMFAVIFIMALSAMVLFGPAVGVVVLLLFPLLGSALFGSTGTIMGGLLTGILLFLAVLSQTASGATPEPPNVQAMMGVVAAVMLIGIITLWFFAGNLQTILTQAEHATRQIKTVAEIGQTANVTLNSEVLLPQLVEMIRDRMVFYHVQVFLTDDLRRNARLVASTGAAGEQLLARGHSLPVGSQSVIGQVVSQGEMVYATDASHDPVHRANEFLPATRSEIALPLFDGAQVIGALDVQSTRADAFSESDIETLQIMANQISISVRNSRLFDQIRNSLEENRQLYEDSQKNLQEVERLNRMLTGRAWQEYLTSTQREYGVKIDGANLQRRADWTPALQQAAHNKQAVLNMDGEEATIAVPLDVRGQILGAMEITLPPGSNYQEAQEMIQAVADRLGLALDNNRLFEEARTLAQQEHVINDIGGKLQGATDVDEMLRMAVSELRQVLGASRGSVRLRSTTAELSSGDGQQ